MRKQDESIIINNDIELKVIEIKGRSVKLGFTFPKGASVLRKELYDKIMAENMAAAKDNVSVDDLLSSMPKIASSGKDDDQQTDGTANNSDEEAAS
tara:strand:+ start:259 stop:546 length:288 start_codon:yes stop_codon:yes gene_type:complete